MLVADMTIIPKRTESSKAVPNAISTSSIASLPYRPSPAALSPATPIKPALDSSPISSITSNLKTTSNATLKFPEPVSTPLNLPTSPLPRNVLTRRRRYLEKTTTYFASASADAELNSPLEYDRLIRRYQSAAEREREGKKRGWASTLEAGLIRGEARSAEVNDSLRNNTGDTRHRNDAARNTIYGNTQIDWSISDSPETEGASADGQVEQGASLESTTDLAYLREKIAESESLGGKIGQPRPSAFALSETNKAQEKRRGEERWHALLADRFVSGNDENFDYRMVDEDEGLDEDWAAKKVEEDWFEEEEAMIDGSAEGETGLQDF